MIQWIIGGVEYVVILQEWQILCVIYVGGGVGLLIFDVILIEWWCGIFLFGSVVVCGCEVYFYSDDGFFYFDGLQLVLIGVEWVDCEFVCCFNILDQINVFLVIDLENKFYVILFFGFLIIGLGSEIFVYYWLIRCWVEIEQIVELLFEIIIQQIIVEIVGFDFVNIDISFFVNILIDSLIFKGGEMCLGVFDQMNVLVFFDGMVKWVVVDIQEWQLLVNCCVLVNWVWLLVEGGVFQVLILFCNDLCSVLCEIGFCLLLCDGQVYVYVIGCYYCFWICLEVGDDIWSYIQGVQIENDEIQDMGVFQCFWFLNIFMCWKIFWVMSGSIGVSWCRLLIVVLLWCGRLFW